MLDPRPDLTELCRAHELGVELVEDCSDLDQLLDRTLAECERRLQRGEEGLRGLILLALQARRLQREGDPDEEAAERDLEQVNSELRRAQKQLEHLQKQLDGTAELLDAHAGEGSERSAGPTPERLEELLRTFAELCHQINNPLTAVMGRSQMLQLKLDKAGDEGLKRLASVIEESGQRVADCVQELAQAVYRAREELL